MTELIIAITALLGALLVGYGIGNSGRRYRRVEVVRVPLVAERATFRTARDEVRGWLLVTSRDVPTDRRPAAVTLCLTDAEFNAGVKRARTVVHGGCKGATCRPR